MYFVQANLLAPIVAAVINFLAWFEKDANINLYRCKTLLMVEHFNELCKPLPIYAPIIAMHSIMIMKAFNKAQKLSYNLTTLTLNMHDICNIILQLISPIILVPFYGVICLSSWLHVVKCKKLQATQYTFTSNTTYIHISQNHEFSGELHSKASDIKQLSQSCYTGNRELHKKNVSSVTSIPKSKQPFS